MKKVLKKGFTLIELLIVIGILGILVAAVLLTINPAETQRKARDQQRLKDLSNLVAVIDQAASDGKFDETASTTWDSLDNDGAKTCSASWVGPAGAEAINFCDYVNVMPIDPVNKVDQSQALCSLVAGEDVRESGAGRNLVYYVAWDLTSKTYEVNIRQESLSNCKRIEDDGGDSLRAVEAGNYVSDTGALTLIDGDN